MSRPPEKLTAPVDVSNYEKRVFMLGTRHEHPLEIDDHATERVRMVLEALREWPVTAEVKHIQRDHRAYNTEIIVTLKNGEIWEVRVFSSTDELHIFKQHLSQIWKLSKNDSVENRLRIRQLAPVVVTSETDKGQVIKDFKKLVDNRYQQSR